MSYLIDTFLLPTLPRRPAERSDLDDVNSAVLRDGIRSAEEFDELSGGEREMNADSQRRNVDRIVVHAMLELKKSGNSNRLREMVSSLSISVVSAIVLD